MYGRDLPSTSRTGQVAQLVEQRIENPRVGSSILPLATIVLKKPAPLRFDGNPTADTCRQTTRPGSIVPLANMHPSPEADIS